MMVVTDAVRYAEGLVPEKRSGDILSMGLRRRGYGRSIGTREKREKVSAVLPQGVQMPIQQSLVRKDSTE